MAKIPVKVIVRWFQRMYEEHWKYTWGHAQEGDVDCSGAFVFAYRKYKKSIYHGSNTIARRYVKKLLPVSKAAPGMAAFKVRKPGSRYYDLPAKFLKGGSAYTGDLNDYYHIGLVDEDSKHALNAQSPDTGFGRSPLSKWHFVAELNDVEYPASQNQKEGDSTMQEMTAMVVTCPANETVNVRDKANGKRIDKLKPGTTVKAGEDVNGWREIVYGDGGGYMASEFLKPFAAATPTDLTGSAEPQAYVKTITSEDLKAVSFAMDTMETAIKVFRDILGAG